MRRLDGADATGEHDRLVIAAKDPTHFGFEGAEIAAQIRPAEFIVERRGTNRALEHDVERRSNARGLAGRWAFPELLMAGNAQIRHGIADQARLRLRAAAGRPFVADLAAGAG